MERHHAENIDGRRNYQYTVQNSPYILIANAFDILNSVNLYKLVQPNAFFTTSLIPI